MVYETFPIPGILTTRKDYFKHEVKVDVVWLEERPVLYIIDTHTHFQDAIPIGSKQSEKIWYECIKGWVSLYVGYPDVVRLEQEARFRNDNFTTVVDMHVMELQLYGVGSHKCIGIGESYHIPSRRILKLAR